MGRSLNTHRAIAGRLQITQTQHPQLVHSLHAFDRSVEIPLHSIHTARVSA